MIFPLSADYSSDILACTASKCVIQNTASGADLLRYTFDYGSTWSNWVDYQTNITVPSSVNVLGQGWSGIHVIVQYWSLIATTSAAVVHGDADYRGEERRVPRFIARGEFNKWGLDRGLTLDLGNAGSDEGWNSPVGREIEAPTPVAEAPHPLSHTSLQIMMRWPASIQLNMLDYDDNYYSDPRGDGLIQRMPPNSLCEYGGGGFAHGF